MPPILALAIAGAVVLGARVTSAQSVGSETLYREEVIRKRAVLDSPVIPTIRLDQASPPSRSVVVRLSRSRPRFVATPAIPSPEFATDEPPPDRWRFDAPSGRIEPYFVEHPAVKVEHVWVCPALSCQQALPFQWEPDETTNIRRTSVFFVSREASVLSATVLWFLRRPRNGVVLVPTFGGGRIGLVAAGPFRWL